GGPRLRGLHAGGGVDGRRRTRVRGGGGRVRLRGRRGRARGRGRRPGRRPRRGRHGGGGGQGPPPAGPLPGRAGPAGGGLGEQPQDEPVQLRGNVGPVPRRRRRFDGQVLPHQRGHRLAVERRVAGQQRVQGAAEGVQVGAGVRGPPLVLLRRHVGGRAQHP